MHLAATGAIAWMVYRRFGLALLRTAWLNLEFVRAVALVAMGVPPIAM